MKKDKKKGFYKEEGMMCSVPVNLKIKYAKKKKEEGKIVLGEDVKVGSFDNAGPSFKPYFTQENSADAILLDFFFTEMEDPYIMEMNLKIAFPEEKFYDLKELTFYDDKETYYEFIREQIIFYITNEFIPRLWKKELIEKRASFLELEEGRKREKEDE